MRCKIELLMLANISLANSSFQARMFSNKLQNGAEKGVVWKPAFLYDWNANFTYMLAYWRLIKNVCLNTLIHGTQYIYVCWSTYSLYTIWLLFDFYSVCSFPEVFQISGKRKNLLWNWSFRILQDFLSNPRVSSMP